MLETLPLSSQVEYNISGTRKENKKKSTPSLKFGITSKLQVRGGKYISSSCCITFFLLILLYESFAISTRVKPQVLLSESLFSLLKVLCKFNKYTQVFFLLRHFLPVFVHKRWTYFFNKVMEQFT